MNDLKHPSRGGYDEGHSGICWPFMDDPEYDSESDDGSVHGYWYWEATYKYDV